MVIADGNVKTINNFIYLLSVFGLLVDTVARVSFTVEENSFVMWCSVPVVANIAVLEAEVDP